MATRISTDPVATGLSIGLCGDALKDLLNRGPGLLRSAGHEARAMSRAFLAAGDAGADEKEALSFDVLGAALGVGEMAVAAVDDDIAGFEMREQLIDEGVDGRARLHEQDDAAWALEQGHELRDGVCADHVRARGGAGQKGVGLRGGAVVHGHGVAVVVHVEHEVLAHDGQADEADVSGGHVGWVRCGRGCETGDVGNGDGGGGVGSFRRRLAAGYWVKY